MKALIITLILSLSFQAQAYNDSPSELNPTQQAQLFKTLNSMDLETVTTVLSVDALAWYEGKVEAAYHEDDFLGDTSKPIHGRVDIGLDPFADNNAPTFD